MLELILAFVAGMIVMDVMWAYKLGIPQFLYARWKYKRVVKTQQTELDNLVN